MLLRIRRSWRRVRRSFIATATVAAVAACAVGVPFPAAVHKSSAERYPCENHPCGCADAASCWQHCCCMSDAAKLAWAKQAGVTPPAFVVARAAHEAADHDHESHAVAASDCCSSKASAGSTCCSVTKTCCSETTQAEPAPASDGVKFVMLSAAMECRGLSISVALLPPSLPIVSAEFFPPLAVRYEPRVGESSLYEAPCRAIPTPPPQSALA